MNIGKIPLVALLLIIPAIVSAKPKVEYKLNDGECENGGSWWVVQRYVDGSLVDLWGLDCNGNEWCRHNPGIVSADPTEGETPTYTGIGENGQMWYSVVHFSPEGTLTWGGGRDANGMYWVMEGNPSGSGGASTGLN